MTTPASHSDAEFFRKNERLIGRLRSVHPDRSDADLVHALRQAEGLTEPSGNVRLVEVVALLLLN